LCFRIQEEEDKENCHPDTDEDAATSDGEFD
jgi:hypothetical protein